MKPITTYLVMAIVLGAVLVAAYIRGGSGLVDTAHAKTAVSTELIPLKHYPDWEPEDREPHSIPMISDVKQEKTAGRKLRFRKMKLGVADIEKPVVNLDSKTIATDVYKPVRFMMREHSLRMEGDCASCHHKTPADVPETIKEERLADVMSCESCHQGAVPVESPEDRLSLKAAYHNKCISCHKETISEKAPVDCTGCHKQNIPSHETLFKVSGNPEEIEPAQMTALCLECHPGAGDEMVKSAHYTWSGKVSEWTQLKTDAVETGKRLNAINNNCISPFGDWDACVKCHAGYGLRDENGEFSKKPENVDCLICHAEEDTYAKSKKGLPEADVDLAWTASMVREPTRAACGTCHYKAGGGNGRKGTLYNALNDPDRSLDVHMGGEFNLSCVDCHKGRQHKIPGRHSSVGVDEGIVECTDCHSSKPHEGNPLAKHIDRHTESVQCSTCHIPTYSRAQQTRDMWDWRTVGEREEVIKNEQGKPVYLPDEGTFRWRQNVKPHYSWDNGHTERYVLGDKIDDTEDKVYLSRNMGDISDPGSKIGPFKLFQGWQPADAEHNYLVVPQNTGEHGIWESKEWIGAIELGMKDTGFPFSGEIKFVETELRFRPRHEVAPKENALTCVQCHTSALETETAAADSCRKCHNESSAAEIRDMIAKGKGKQGHYMPWKELGYKGDPIRTGGRFKKSYQ